MTCVDLARCPNPVDVTTACDTKRQYVCGCRPGDETATAEGIRLTGYQIRRGTIEIDTGQPWIERAPTDERTVTVTGKCTRGDIRISATARGPDAVETAGWLAFTRLLAAAGHPSALAEDWAHDPDTGWTMVDAEHGNTTGDGD